MEITITYEIAMAAATDAGNRNMRKDDRIFWNEDDYAVASTVFGKLMQKENADVSNSNN